MASWKFWRGVLLCLSKSGVGIFWPKFFLASQKFQRGVLLPFSKNDLRIFSHLWGVPKYENFRMSWNIQICKQFWPRSILCSPFWAPKVLAEPTLAAILTQLHLLPRAQIFTEASYFVLVYLCLIWCWYLEWCRSHRASKLAFCLILGSSTFWSHFYPLLIETQWGFLWQNWPPWWVVSRSGVTSVGGYFYVCPNLVLEFFGQNFFLADQKFWRGSTFTFLQKWPWNFSQPWGVPNMKTSECHETSRYAKFFDLEAFFVHHFGPQSSGWANFGCHFDPVTPIAQGPDFYWSFILCLSLPVPNLVLISWMM